MNNNFNRGLTDSQVWELKLKFGDNLLPEKEKENWLTILISQINNPLSYLVLTVGMVSLMFKEFFDAGLIFLVTAINIIMGFIQEFSAQKTLEALKKIIKTRSFVIRNGVRKNIETKDLVPGDLVVISSGDKIPADGTIIKGTGLLINEAILTGEEEAVAKSEKGGNNKIYMGTTVVYGQGIMRVDTIGIETKFGKIGKSISSVTEEDSPLQKRLKSLTKDMIRLVIVICVVILIFGLVRGGGLWYSLRISVILSLAAIPEGLPIAVTVILALGVNRILKRKGLVKKLLSIETLGSTSIICIDKTGTLTEGKMQVVKTDFKNKKNAFLSLTLLNERKVAMEAAIWNFLEKEKGQDPNKIFNSYERVYDEPFDSKNKYKFAVVKIGNKNRLFAMGAPDILVNFCNIPQNEKREILANIDNWANMGLRILGLAEKEDIGNKYELEGLNWLGLIAIEDPVRKEASETLNLASSAGIETKIVTGDYLPTAISIAKKIGMQINTRNVMDAKGLENLSDEELEEKIDDIKIFARVTPLQKLKIVQVLQKKGEIVAMMGDGINDAPALKKANIGIAVENATDVAKEASDLILLDSNFKTIVSACEEGRLILSNIKKVAGYVLSNSFAEIILISGSLILNLPTPLTVAQILWINLICDGPPDIMLGFEPKEKGIMKLTPKEVWKQEILSPTMKLLIFVISLTVGLSGLCVFWYYNNVLNETILARSITFTILASVSMVYIFAFKNMRTLIVKTDNFFENKFLIAGVIYGFSLIFLAVYNPFLNKILNITPLTLNHWVIVGSISIFTLLIIEASKIISRNVLKQSSL